jgi:hypothetical protein
MPKPRTNPRFHEIPEELQDTLISLDTSEYLLLYRLLLFAALMNDEGMIHLLSAFQYLVGLFGMHEGELRFQQTFLYPSKRIDLSSQVSLADFASHLWQWDLKHRKILTKLDRNKIYQSKVEYLHHNFVLDVDAEEEDDVAANK